MARDGFNSIQKGKKMNTLITWNQLRDMEESQNRFNRFLGGFTQKEARQMESFLQRMLENG